MTEQVKLSQDIEADLAEIGRLVDGGDYQGAMRFAQERGIPIELIRASAKPKEPEKKGQITRRALAPAYLAKPKGVFISPKIQPKREF